MSRTFSLSFVLMSLMIFISCKPNKSASDTKSNRAAETQQQIDVSDVNKKISMSLVSMGSSSANIILDYDSSSFPNQYFVIDAKLLGGSVDTLMQTPNWQTLFPGKINVSVTLDKKLSVTFSDLLSGTTYSGALILRVSDSNYKVIGSFEFTTNPEEVHSSAANADIPTPTPDGGSTGGSTGGNTSGTNVTPPDPVTATLSATYSAIDVAWNGVARAESYNIYWSETPGVTFASNKITNAQSMYRHLNLTGGATYYYKVASVIGTYETMSAEVSAVPTSFPARVTGVWGDPTTSSTQTISWQEALGATSYHIYWSTSPGVTTGSTRIDVSASPYVHTGRTVDSMYYYRIAGVDSALMEGPLSDEVKVLTGGIAHPVVFSGYVNTTEKSVDGSKIYVGGNFSKAGQWTGAGVPIDIQTARVAVDPAFLGVTGGDVLAVAEDGSNGWYIGGKFTEVQGYPQPRLAHIFANGKLDPNWRPNPDSYVNTIAVKGNKVYVGGAFYTVSSKYRPYVAELDSSGTATDWYATPNSLVSTIAATDTTVYFGGSFTQVGGQARKGIAAVSTSGELLSWNPNPSAVGIGAQTVVYSVIPSGNNVFVGGNFNSIGGQAREFLAQIDASGNATSWNPNPNSVIYAMSLYGSNLYVAGLFSQIGGLNRYYIGAVSAITGSVTSWNTSIVPGLTKAIKATANAIYIGGQICAAFDLNGTQLPWNPSVNSTVYAIGANSRQVYLGGAFMSAGMIERQSLAALDTSGNLLSWNPRVNGEVFTIAAVGTKIYVGGRFNYVGAISGPNATSRSNIASLELNGSGTSWNPNSNGDVYAIKFIGNNAYVGGEFTSIGGQTRKGIAAVDLTTGNATSWDIAQGTTQTVSVSTIDVKDQLIYFGGRFVKIGSQDRLNFAVASTSGTLSDWNPMSAANNSGVNGTRIDQIKMFDGGAIISGYFVNLLNQPRLYLAAIDFNGQLLAWNPSTMTNQESIHGFFVDGANTFVSGRFANMGGQNRNSIAAINMTTGQATTWSPADWNPAKVFGSGLSDYSVNAIYKLGNSVFGIYGNSSAHLVAKFAAP